MYPSLFQPMRRPGLRLAAVIIVVFGSMFSLGVTPTVYAAAIIVNTTDHEINMDGDCSLHEAIQAANEDQAVDACTAGSGMDSIRVPAGTYTGGLVIQGDLSMSGAGADQTIVDNNYGPTVITILSGTVSVSGMTFQKGSIISGAGGGIVNHGTLVLTNTIVTNNQAVDIFDTEGGGIYNVGTLTIQHSSVTHNSATLGGGILNLGKLTVIHSTVSNNSAPFHRFGATRGNGAGIANAGELTVANSTFSNNDAGVAGGGIFNSGTATVTDSSFSQNRAALGGGGGISNGHVMTVTGTLFTDNIAAFSILPDGFPIEGSGGGIANSGTLMLSNSTISGNKANRHGGGIDNGGVVTINNVTITTNVADHVYNQYEFDQIGDGGGISNRGSATVMNSLVAGNSDRSGEAPDCSGNLTLLDYTLLQNTQGCIMASDPTGNLLGVDPMLGPLQENGGPTPTHALLPGSPAIDAGHPAAPGSGGTACKPTDQRGVARPQDGNGDSLARCDMGAFERESAVPPSPAQQIRALKTDVQQLVAAGDLNHGQGNALTAKLDAALRSLDRGQSQTAANQFQAFVHQVEAFQRAGVLSPAQAQRLAEQANAIVRQIQR